MKTMNGITNELLVKKAKRNWRTRCGAFLLAILASWCGGVPQSADAATLTRPGGYGQNIAIDTSQTDAQNVNIGQPYGYTMGQGGALVASWIVAQGHQQGLDLYDISLGRVQAYSINTTGNVRQANPVTFNIGDTFTSGGSQFTLAQSMTWTGIFNADNGVLNTQGNTLTISRADGFQTRVGDIFTINNVNNNNNATGGWLEVYGGTNLGTVDITTGGLRLNANIGGTIKIESKGVLEIANGLSLNSDLIGAGYDNPLNGGGGRGIVNLLGNAKFTASWAGEISVASNQGAGYRLDATGANGSGANGPLNTLRVTGNRTDVMINSQGNINNARVILASGGMLTKDGRVGDLAITNTIEVYGEGSLNAGTVSYIPWNGNASSLHDGGRRFIIQGELQSTFINAMLNINQGGSGTVVLANTANSYNGNFKIWQGQLEISSQQQLGYSDDNSRRYVEIGGYGSSATPATFRVVGTSGTSQSITHYVNLLEQGSSYEVFTVGALTSGTIDPLAASVAGDDLGNLTMRDQDRFTVHQMGQISGAGSLNKKGDGVLVLERYNNYTGDTIVWHGVLQISNENSINNSAGSMLLIGGAPGTEDGGFRPVFETTLGKSSTNDLRINSHVMINERNSIIRTTGVGNTTTLTGTISTGTVIPTGGTTGPNNMPYETTLNKDGAGKLVLAGLGQWGHYGSGDLNILQGTVEFSKSSNLAGGTIHIGTDWKTYKNLETTDNNAATGAAVPYRAILRLADNVGGVAIGNNIELASPHDDTDPLAGSYIDVGVNSELMLKSAVLQSPNTPNSDLNKIGKGTLSLDAKGNTYSGWTNIYEGTVKTTVANNMSSSAGVDLIGDNTTFDMSTDGADQTLKGLRGIDTLNPTDTDEWTRKVLIGANTLTLDLQNFKTGDSNSTTVLNGHIVGTGTLVKSGLTNSVFASGFDGYSGKFDIQKGTLRTLTDTTITGLTGKAGTYLDILDKTLTVNISSSQGYDGIIMSSTTLPTVGEGHVIKDGAGTLTTGFYEINAATGFVKAFQGDLTLKQGSIISNTDYHMLGGNSLTFYATTNSTGGVDILTLDVSKHKAIFEPTSEVHVNMSDVSTGWKSSTGDLTVGKILGNDKSDYRGLVADQTDSLFYSLALQDVYGTNRHDLYVNLRVNGFGGVGNTYNTTQVGENLDRIRVTDLSNTNLGPILQDIWAAGSNINDPNCPAKPGLDETNRDYRLRVVRGLFQQMSGDTIANAMFMGFNKPWQQAFDRLNLDSQMVYVAPQPQQPLGYRGQSIANMRNLWFTPTVQVVNARSDGNARGYGIDRPGYQIGFDKRVAQNASVGFMLGYTAPKLHQGDDRVEGNDFQFGLYGGAMVGYYVEMKGYIGFGHQNYKSNRNVYFPNDQLVPDGNGGWRAIGGTTRSQVMHGRYDSDTFNFSFEVARPLFLGFAILRPSIGLDSEHLFRYGFTETGDALAMRYDRASLSRTRARFGLSLETTSYERVIFSGRLGYSCLLGGRDYASIKGQYVGAYADPQTIRSVAVGKSYFDAGVGARMFLNPSKTLGLVGNYDASIANRWAEHQAEVGFTYIY